MQSYTVTGQAAQLPDGDVRYKHADAADTVH